MGERFDYTPIAIRSSAVLTDSYVAGTVIGGQANVQPHLLNQLILFVDFTKGSLTTAEIKIEFSKDNTNWYQETSTAFTAGTGTTKLAERQIDTTGKYRIAIPIMDAFIRISAKGTGTVTNSLMAITAIVGRS